MWTQSNSGFLTVGQQRLEYASWGPPPGQSPTLVLLHEGLGCVALWRDFPARLRDATGWGVAAFSRAGYGSSSRPALPRPTDYMTREAQGIVPGVLDRLGVQECVLLGHSDGATISAIHAGSVADRRVRGLVLIAPHFFAEPEGLQAIAQAREAYDKGDLRERLARYHDDPDAAFLGWNEAWLSPGFLDWDVSDVLAHIRVPVLAIQGRDDQYGTLAQVRAIEENCPAPVETLVLDACRHAPHAEHPGLVLAAISEFCARLARGRVAR